MTLDAVTIVTYTKDILVVEDEPSKSSHTHQYVFSF